MNKKRIVGIYMEEINTYLLIPKPSSKALSFKNSPLVRHVTKIVWLDKVVKMVLWIYDNKTCKLKNDDLTCLLHVVNKQKKYFQIRLLTLLYNHVFLKT